MNLYLYFVYNTLLNIIFPITKLSFLLVDSGGYIVGGSLVFFWSGLVWAVWAVLFSLSSGCLVCWFVRRGFVLLCSGCWVWLCCCLSGVLFVWWVLSRFLLWFLLVVAWGGCCALLFCVVGFWVCFCGFVLSCLSCVTTVSVHTTNIILPSPYLYVINLHHLT